ncbi:TPA: hypothetical protein EYP12_07360, partial [Candidatus Bipolaricaulota bacterium]|nr:hypothetical protein [Candidatus Bipolaricaulota bacterium]
MRRSIALNPNLIRALLTLTILVLVSASTAAAQPAAVQGQGQNQGHAGEADGVEAACLVLLQVTRFISAFLRDPGGVRFEIIDGLLDRGFCARFQVLAFGRTETRLAFESWVRPASEDREVLKGRIREQLLQERAERADIELAFWRAFHLFKELESEGDVNERIIVLLSDGAFTAGSVERLFRETLPYLIREGIRVYIFRFYFLERPALYEIAQATGGLIWPGSRSSLPRALERIEADLFRERERREPARSGSEPRESTPPPAPGPVEVEPKPPLEGFLSSIVKEISVEIQTRRTYWDDETVRLEAAISYRDRMLGPEAIAIDLGGDPGLMRIEGVYASLAGGAQSQSQPLRFAGSRWMADLSLPVGTHTVELIVKGRVIRGTEEEPFQVQVEALRQIQI